jgi:hypothetical protein
VRNFFCIDSVLDRSHSGWLIGLTQDEIKTPLCYKTKVIYIGKNINGEIIKVQEGNHIGKILIIPFQYKDKNTYISYLSKDIQFDSTFLKLNRNKRILWINNLGEFAVKIDSGIPKGKYYLQIPERPVLKKFNPNYFNESLGGSRFAQSWFRLVSEKGKFKDIFLHYGSYSDGCITVINNSKFSVWNKIYLALMKCRLNKKYLTSLVVI